MRHIHLFVARLHTAVVQPLIGQLQRLRVWVNRAVRKAVGIWADIKSWYRLPWSLDRIAKEDEADWFTFNSHRQHHQFRWFDRALIYGGERPIQVCFALTAVLLGAYWVLLALPDWFVINWTQWGDSDRLGYFTALWSIQATLAALAYPIVIAFMAVFLQRRPAASAYLMLYMMHSGAVLAGLSSVFLVLAMLVQYILIPVSGTANLPKWASLDAYWFLLNASLTLLFLYRTIEFLNRDAQLDFAKKYAVNIALPRDIGKLYKSQLIQAAHRKDWIPVPSYTYDTRVSTPTVLLNSFGFRSGEIQCQQILRTPSRCHNIRLWPFRILIMSWYRRASKIGVTLPVGEDGMGGGPLLMISVDLGSIYAGAIPLAKVDKGPALRSWEKQLLKWSLSFKPISTEKNDVSVEALIAEFKSELSDAIERSNNDLFEKAFRDLTDIHRLLLDASFVKFEDGTVGSIAVYPGKRSAFPSPMNRDWVATYRSIFEAAIKILEEDSKPFETLCRLPAALHTDSIEQLQLEIAKNILALPMSLMYQLGNWWEKQIERQGHAHHNHNCEASLQFPMSRAYKGALDHFIQAWENARFYYMPQPEESKPAEWKAVQSHAALSSTHLEQTARLLLAAVARGDREAAEWFADVMAKWWGRNATGSFTVNLHGKTQLLTVSHLSLDWPQVVDAIGIGNVVSGATPLNLWRVQHGVLLAALKNHWTDIRIVTVCLLMSMSSDGTSTSLESSLAFDIALGLIQGKLWRAGGVAIEHLANIGAPDYLTAIVRQECANIQYSARIVSLIDDVLGRNTPTMLSSRVYVQQAAEDGRQIQDCHLALLVASSKSNWEIPTALRNEIGIWMFIEHERLPSLRTMLSSWRRTLEQPQEALPGLVDVLLKKLTRPYTMAEGRARVNQGFAAVENFMEQKRAEILNNEEVSVGRLQTLGAYLFAINDMPVYWGEIEHGTSILLAREAFEKILFKEYAHSRFVDVTATAQAGDSLLYDLHVKFSRRVTVGMSRALRIRYENIPAICLGKNQGPGSGD